MDITINLAKKQGPIKPVNGICNGVTADNAKYFKAAHLPYTRLHDCQLAHYYAADIAAVFPNFDADENDESNYDFMLTDEYIARIVGCGTKIIYRLGGSMEHAPLFFHNAPPPDYEKWARIACRIIAHYNEGWAHGFNYGIEYWEIWNEPDCILQPALNGQWSGSAQEFFRFYCVVSKIIKAAYPRLKIGGYAAAAVDEPGRREFCDDFLACQAAGGGVLDFFSYHAYGDSVSKLENRIAFVTGMLARHGYGNAEQLCTEYCYLWEYEGVWDDLSKPDNAAMKKAVCADMTGAPGGAYTMAALITFQNSPIAIANLYRTDFGSMWSAPFDMFDEPNKPYFALLAFDKLAQAGCQAESTVTGCPGVYACAAAGESDFAFVIANYTGENRAYSFEAVGAKGEYEVKLYFTDAQRNFELGRTFSATDGASDTVYLRAGSFVTVCAEAKR